MTYSRPPGAPRYDYLDAKPHEQLLLNNLPEFTVDQSASTDKLDFWVPGYLIDDKEKKSNLGKPWHRLDGVDPEDIFVLDELAYRKALLGFPYAFFLLHDKPNQRHFLAPIWELACCERKRLTRFSPSEKGKFLVDMTQFHSVEIEEVHATCSRLLSEMGWKVSECVGLRTIEEVK